MAQQQIITKPYVGELQDDDSLFINHDGALRQVKKKDADFASSEYVRTYVDNATVASARNATNATNATKAAQDSDGNAINTTYRKISDSYSKTEVDAKVGNSSSSIVITTDDLIANYKFAQLMALLESGKAVYLKTTKNDEIGANKILNIDYYNTNGGVSWSCPYFDDAGVSYSCIINTQDTHGDGHISFSYAITPANTVTTVSTIDIAVSAWGSTSKTAKVSASGVTFYNAVDVAPAESSFDDYVNAGIRATEQSYGELTFKCKTIPTKTISVNIKAISTKPLINSFRVN